MRADSKKLSGVYGMSAEGTFDEDLEIDWDTFDWDDMPAAEDTETNEANKDSVATLNHDPHHDDWDDDLEMDRSALFKAIIDKCEKDGHATSSTVDAEAVDEFVLATFGTTKVKRGLMGEQLQMAQDSLSSRGRPAARGAKWPPEETTQAPCRPAMVAQEKGGEGAAQLGHPVRQVWRDAG